MLVRLQDNHNSCILGGNIDWDNHLEAVWPFPQKLNTGSPQWPSNFTARYLPTRKESMCPQKASRKNLHRVFVTRTQLQTAWHPSTGKWPVVHSDSSYGEKSQPLIHATRMDPESGPEEHAPHGSTSWHLNRNSWSLVTEPDQGCWGKVLGRGARQPSDSTEMLCYSQRSVHYRNVYTCQSLLNCIYHYM